MLPEWRRLFRESTGALVGAWQRRPLLLFRGEPLLSGKLKLTDVAPLIDAGTLRCQLASWVARWLGDWRPLQN